MWNSSLIPQNISGWGQIAKGLVQICMLLVLNRCKHREASEHLINLRGKVDRLKINKSNTKVDRFPWEMWRVHLKGSTAWKGHGYPSSGFKEGVFQGVLKRLGQGSPCERTRLALGLTSRTEVQPEEKLLEEKQNWIELGQRRWRKEMVQMKRDARKNSQEISGNKLPFYWTCEKRKEKELCEVEKLSESSFCLKSRKAA